LALERLLAGELPAGRAIDVRAHVDGCAQCREALANMESARKDFSERTRSLDARAAFVARDRTWRRNAMLVALVPVVAAAFVAAVPFVRKDTAPQPPPAVASVTPIPDRQARVPEATTTDIVQPRGVAPKPVLREVSLRGQPMRFGEGTLATEQGPFVLEHTDVRATVTGFVSSVVVTQEFSNPFPQPIEAVYVFPLPDDSAVDEMELTAGNRTIRAQIHKREDARRIYEQAKSEGRRAALLDQERPNIFTQSVANLLPGERVKVRLQYAAPLHYDDGVYTFNFPMTVGPRFIPGVGLPGQSQGTGVVPDTDRVLDASRISPPVARSGGDVSVRVHLEAGAPIEELTSGSHALQVSRASTTADVSLASAAEIPNRDFILRWRVTGPQKRAALLASGGAGGTFALLLMPEVRSAEPAPLPKEMIFVIDTSCSMSGPPLDAAKRAMRSAMEQMNPDDTFMLIDFADKASSFHDTPLPNLPNHVGRAIAYLQSLPASGGTNQLDGIERALRLPPDPKRLREVLLMTDGFIGNETEIFSAAQRDLGGARIFGFGVGNSVNHYLLSRLSQVGRGFYQYVRPAEDPEPAVERFVRRIERPLLRDITIDWGGLDVSDVLPRAVPDLFDAQPVIVMGRYRSPGRGIATVSGTRDGKRESLQVVLDLPVNDGAAPGLKAMWARARIEELMQQQHDGERAEIVRDVTTLGLEYHLVTSYTSLVAADDQRVTAKPGETVAVPTTPVAGTESGGETVMLQQKRMNTIQVIRGSSEPRGPAPVTLTPVAKPPANGHLEYFQTSDGKVTPNVVPDPAPETAEPARPQHKSPPAHIPIYDSNARETKEATVAKAERPEKPSKPAVEAKGGDDEFSKAFGGGGNDVLKQLSKATQLDPDDGDKPKKREIYIPPAPGQASADVRDSLGQSDIMEVVKGNVPAIQGCVEKQRAREPGRSGKIVMKWTILTNGKTAKIEIVSLEFKDTYLATCLTGLIKTWQFPRTHTQGDPVVFPFKF
jgi:Ca-activated chloride channel family protein